jgi:putative lipoprotein
MLCACSPLPPKDDPWTSRDKYKHAGASAVIGAVAVRVARDRDTGHCDAFRIGAAVSIGIGAGKELLDQEFRHKGWSWRDLAWDTAGGTLGAWLASACW